MLGKTSESDLSEHLYDLIYELNAVSPSVLLAVLPQLEFKLKVWMFVKFEFLKFEELFEIQRWEKKVIFVGDLSVNLFLVCMNVLECACVLWFDTVLSSHESKAVSGWYLSGTHPSVCCLWIFALVDISIEWPIMLKPWRNFLAHEAKHTIIIQSVLVACRSLMVQHLGKASFINVSNALRVVRCCFPGHLTVF